MRKTKLLTSIAALALVLGLGACGGNDEEEATPEAKTVLGALDATSGVYYYFNGETTSNGTNDFLAVTTSWDEAVNVTVEALEAGGDALSFVDAEGATKYVAYAGSSTGVTLSDEAYTWVWLDDLAVYAADNAEGRVLVLYEDNPSFRAYAQNDDNLAHGHVTVLTEEPESATPATPAEPEPATAIKLEEVTSLTSGQSYYFGTWTNETSYNLATGALNSTGYRLATTTEATEAALFTATGSDNDGWTLTLADGTYVYAYLANGYADIGLSSEETVPESGVKTFSWSTNINTLCTTQIVSNKSNGEGTYKFSYFEFWTDYICLYGQDSADSANNAAHFYTVAA